ncbi:MAG: CHC2 zinc finger domain-containing protein, partial [Thermodesulfobacteriota bacterium]
MIDREEIKTIKQNTDLAAVIQSCGISLKKSGKSYKGYCPFHADGKSPSLSVTPAENLWQCFGCGAGGDVIDFIRKHDGISFKEAVQQLSGAQLSTSKKKPVKEKNDNPVLTPAHYKLLKRVVAFYHTAFSEDPRAMEYLQGRGITDKTLFADYRIGFANGTLLNVLPDDGETINQLGELGILNAKGKEHFYGCATFPLFDANNNPVGIYGRRVDGMGDTALHLYLPGERRGIFNRQGAATGPVVHLTESILDSLSLINGGIKNTIPCYGTNGLTQEIIDYLRLPKQKISTVYLCFDADDAGDQGAKKAATRLEQEGITAYRVKLPEGYDLNNFFHPDVKDPANPKEAYDDLALLAAGLEPAPKKEQSCEYKPLEEGFSLITDDRHYEVKGIAKKQNKLKATVKGIKKEKGKDKKRFHVDTVDFYSARSRAFLTRGLPDLFGA